MQNFLSMEPLTLGRMLVVIGFILAPFVIGALYIAFKPSEEGAERAPEIEEDFWTFP